MRTLGGDMNCDGVINSTDTGLLLRAIRYFNGTDTWPFECPALNGDFNGDGVVTISDISGYSAALNAGWTGPSAAYDWDAENRLVRARPVAGTEADGVSKVEFVYDSGWRRVRKTVTPWDEQTSNWASAPSLDRKFLWSGWRMLLEIDVPAGGPEDVIRKFAWGLDLAGLGGAVNSLEQAGTIGGLLAVREYDVSGAPEPDDPVDYVYLYDANGNVGQVVDWSHDAQQPGAALAARYEYDPYGGVTKAEGSYAADNAWRFSTKQWDDETGLGWWGARYYDPIVGRWISVDPIGERGGYNTYSYVSNAPTETLDSTGLVGWWVYFPIGAMGRPATCLPRPGRCTEERLEELQGRVELFCKDARYPRARRNPPHRKATRAWCLEARQRRVNQHLCASARMAVNVECFLGGDPRHQEKERFEWDELQKHRENFDEWCHENNDPRTIPKSRLALQTNPQTAAAPAPAPNPKPAEQTSSQNPYTGDLPSRAWDPYNPFIRPHDPVIERALEDIRIQTSMPFGLFGLNPSIGLLRIPGLLGAVTGGARAAQFGYTGGVVY